MTSKPAPPAKPVPAGFTTLTEGQATILYPKGNQVFYNKVQVFNRDLSIVAIKTFAARRAKEQQEARAKEQAKEAARKQRAAEREQAQAQGKEGAQGSAPAPEKSDDVVMQENKQETKEPKEEKEEKVEGLKIMEALSASGLRSIRYFREIGGVSSILVNDWDQAAVDTIKRNVEFNDLSPESELIPNQGDAAAVLMQHKNAFDVVDLDPYGTAAPFLDPAVQAVKSGGLLAVTCTDKAVLCGNNSEACFAKYQVMPLRGVHCSESAVRIVLTALQSAAARHRRYIVPVLSLSIDFYVRMFVRVYESAHMVKLSAANLSHVYQCNGCSSFHLQPVGKVVESGNSRKFSPGSGPVVDMRCDQCGYAHKMGGPIWNQPLHDPAFCQEALDIVKSNPGAFATEKRIIGTLTVAKNELPDPLLYEAPTLCKLFNVSTPKNTVFLSALLNAGYKISQTHASPIGFKTDAPSSFIWDMMRAYTAQNPPKHPPSGNQPGAHILAKAATAQVDFTPHKEAKFSTEVAKFLPNPEDNWGPKARAVGNIAKLEKKSDADENEEGDEIMDAGAIMQAKSMAKQGTKRGRSEKRAAADKTKLCQQWAYNQTCKWGDECRYSHDPTTAQDVGKQKTTKKQRKMQRQADLMASQGSEPAQAAEAQPAETQESEDAVAAAPSAP